MTGRQWLVLILLVLSVFINYIDRSNLSIAAPLIKNELSLSASDLGALLGAFSWTYALLQLFGMAGWAADRFPAGLVLAGGFFIWSGATALTGAAATFSGLFLARLLLGVGESVTYPCYSRILAGDFPLKHRGLANALIDAGTKLGPSLGTLVGGLLVVRVGWRWFFIVLGVGCMLWLIPWVIWMPKKNIAHHSEAGAPTVLQILKQRSAWGSFFGHFCGNYYWYFLLSWLPEYLVTGRHFSMERMARVGSLLYLVIASATIAAGWFSDRWIHAGGSPTRVRKTVVVFGLTMSTIILPVGLVKDENTAIALLFAACAVFGTYTSNHWAIIQTLAGPLAAGRWTSLMNGVGNLSGVAAAWLTGVMVDKTGSFQLPFITAALVALTGAFLWGVVVQRVEEVDWRHA